MKVQTPLLTRRTGFVLIEILIVILLIALLASGYLALRGKSGPQEGTEPRFPGEAQTLPGRAVQKGHGVECMTNLRQLRQMIQVQTIDSGTYPQALDPSWGVVLQCPVSGYAYVYNPATGQVSCPTPGHERY